MKFRASPSTPTKASISWSPAVVAALRDPAFVVVRLRAGQRAGVRERRVAAERVVAEDVVAFARDGDLRDETAAVVEDVVAAVGVGEVREAAVRRRERPLPILCFACLIR